MEEEFDVRKELISAYKVQRQIAYDALMVKEYCFAANSLVYAVETLKIIQKLAEPSDIDRLTENFRRDIVTINNDMARIANNTFSGGDILAQTEKATDSPPTNNPGPEDLPQPEE
jgi:hypothetical protein